MANFTAGTSFTDGVTNDVTAAKLNALVADAVPTSSLALASTSGTISNFTSSTATLLGAITGSTNVINIGSGQIYKDASGNVGVGTTSPSSKLTVGSGGAIQFDRPDGANQFRLGYTANDTTLKLNFNAGSTLAVVDNSGNVGIGTVSPGSKLHVSDSNVQLRFTNGSSHTRHLAVVDADNSFRITRTGVADDVTIDSSGNVGIGVTNPGEALNINGSTNLKSAIRLQNQGTDVGFIATEAARIGSGSSNNLSISSFGTNSVVLATGTTERLRVTSGGEVYIAGTTDQGAYNLQVNGTGVWGAGAYVNGSDSRIKEDIQPLASGLDVVEKLNPVTYKYKETWSSDQSVQSGFIAQELLTALDGQIYVDGVVQQGGTEGYYSVAYQNLIPVLAKAIQELKAKNDSLEARLEALEAK
jgi:hypothetical protein